MSEHDDSVYVGHMLDTAVRISDLTAGLSRDAFDGDDVLQLAIVHLIQTVGEAASRVTDEFRGNHPEIPWRDIVGMRHRVVHDYLHVDLNIVWEVAMQHIESLIELLEPIVDTEDG